MKKIYSKKGFYWVLLIFVIWAGISTYWYTCQLKGFCSVSNNNKLAITNPDKREKVDILPTDNIPIICDNPVKTKKVVKQKITCSPYLKKTIVYGKANNINEVAKLEKFLNDFEGENLKIDGYYQKTDKDAVIEFQKKYSQKDGFGKKINSIDGIVGPETKEKINLIYCIEKGKEYLEKNN
jgi:peptidoglycan hydrolase-like protein with peptidoglycan-binding domain